MAKTVSPTKVWWFRPTSPLLGKRYACLNSRYTCGYATILFHWLYWEATYINLFSTRAQQLLRWSTVGPKKWGCGCLAPLRGGAGSRSNTMSAGLRPTSVPSGILIHLVVWPQCKNAQTLQTDNGLIAQRPKTVITNCSLKSIFNDGVCNYNWNSTLE